MPHGTQHRASNAVRAAMLDEERGVLWLRTGKGIAYAYVPPTARDAHAGAYHYVNAGASLPVPRKHERVTLRWPSKRVRRSAARTYGAWAAHAPSDARIRAAQTRARARTLAACGVC